MRPAIIWNKQLQWRVTMRASKRPAAPITDTQAGIRAAITADPQNAAYTAAGVEPLYVADPRARILLIGQAPGQRAQDARLFFLTIPVATGCGNGWTSRATSFTTHAILPCYR